MKILNYIFLDDYFKLDFESESGFKIVIGYKRFYFFIKTTTHTTPIYQSKKNAFKSGCISFKLVEVKKS